MAISASNTDKHSPIADGQQQVWKSPACHKVATGDPFDACLSIKGGANISTEDFRAAPLIQATLLPTGLGGAYWLFPENHMPPHPAC